MSATDWVPQDDRTFWREDIDAHVFATPAGAWWWAIGAADTLRCGNCDTCEDAQAEAEDAAGVTP